MSDCGEEVPADIWAGFDFSICTYDLARDSSRDGYLCRSALALAQAAAEQQGLSYARICVVGVNLDQIPANPIDMAATVKHGTRSVAVKSASLRLFPVSVATGYGISDLLSYVGECALAIDDWSRTDMSSQPTAVALSLQVWSRSRAHRVSSNNSQRTA